MKKIVATADLRSKFGPPRDQGPRPTCLAFAASDAHAALRLSWAPLSCEYAFFHAQRRAGRPPGSGAELWSMLETLREDGQPVESGWPYLAETPKDGAPWEPPSDVGALFRRNGRECGFSLNDIAGELDRGHPMIVLLMLSHSFFLPSTQAVIDPASDESPEPTRRHAVVAVGHGTVDGQRAILVRNSWGPKWGDKGHGWLTERFLSPRIFAAATLTGEIDVSSSTTPT